MKCKLCLQDKPLLKKSHIIPEFMYRGLYDDRHKMKMFSPKELSQGKGYVKQPTSGDYEGKILCSDCDNSLIGKYESYASKILYAQKLKDGFTPIAHEYKQGNLSFINFSNIDYHKFKLFLLTILWRSSISSRPLFSQVSLGPHEEIIRRMILTDNPGEEDEYALLFMTVLNDKDMPHDFVGQPRSYRAHSNHRVYSFPIGGVMYFFYVGASSHKVPDEVLSTTIRKTNELDILLLPKGYGWTFLEKYYGLERGQKL